MKRAILILAILTLPTLALGAPITLQWDANSESDLAGYRIYQSNTPGSYDKATNKAAAVNGSVVSCEISYYTGIAAGRHKLTAILTMANGYIDEFDCKRIVVGDS